jgi:hypothetical protein
MIKIPRAKTWVYGIAALLIVGALFAYLNPGAIVGGDFYVRVEDGAGVAISGATVRIFGAGDSYIGTTAAGGKAYFDNFQSGEYTVTVAKDGYPTLQNVRVTVNTNPGAAVDKGFTVVLSASPHIENPDIYGYVRDAAGSGIAAVAISGGGRTASTDANGYYRIDDIAAGTYAFSYVKSGYMSATQSATIGVSNVLMNTMTLRAEQYKVILLVEKDNDVGGWGVKGATISLSNGASTTTNTYGQAGFTLAPGTYNYAVNCDGFIGASGTFVSPSESTIKVKIVTIIGPTRTVEVSGTIGVSGVDAPIQGAKVILMYASETFVAYTDDAGHYSVFVDPSVDISWEVRAEGFIAQTGSISVETTARTLDVDLVSTYDDGGGEDGGGEDGGGEDGGGEDGGGYDFEYEDDDDAEEPTSYVWMIIGGLVAGALLIVLAARRWLA